MTLLTGQMTGDMTMLAFDSAPDFEEPGDTNGDNIYEVTIVVTDSSRQ